jgi:hypothetical protein
MSDFIPNAFIGPTKHYAGGSHKIGFQHNLKVAKEARERPGEWVDLIARASGPQASNKVYTVRHRPSIAFQPAGSFEVRSERRTDGYAVQIRYVGEPS